MGSRRVFLGLPRGVRRAFWLMGNIRVDGSSLCIQVQARSTFLLPDVPLPLLKMRKAINAQQRDRAVILVGVMRMKVDTNIPIKVTNGRRRVKRLSYRHEHIQHTSLKRRFKNKRLTCTPRTFFPSYVPTTVHPSASAAACVFATLTVNSLNTPLKNSKFASCTVSIRISSHSSTTTNCAKAPHGESMYRSRFDDRMFAADLAAPCAVCTRAEQSSDA